MVIFAFGSVDTSNRNANSRTSPPPQADEKEAPVAPSEDAASEKSSGGFSFGKTVVTKAHYDRIQKGMSYRQVVAVIGAEGEEVSRNELEGVPGVMESVETVMYQWQNGNGSNMNAMFQNDKLMQKAQFGLK
jgi:hypothetical protein